MNSRNITPTGNERTFAEDEIIVSKTDLQGRITYVNEVFSRISGYTEEELIRKPHSCIRHPDMPRALYKLLWEKIQNGHEVFAYVVNLCKNGDHYWVYAHITPTFNSQGEITGYHSNRRVAYQAGIETIRGIYAELLREERRHGDRRKGLQESYEMLLRVLNDQQQSYDEFIWSLAA